MTRYSALACAGSEGSDSASASSCSSEGTSSANLRLQSRGVHGSTGSVLAALRGKLVRNSYVRMWQHPTTAIRNPLFPLAFRPCYPSLPPSRAHALAVALRPTQSGMMAFARSAADRISSAWAGEKRVCGRPCRFMDLHEFTSH